MRFFSYQTLTITTSWICRAPTCQWHIKCLEYSNNLAGNIYQLICEDHVNIFHKKTPLYHCMLHWKTALLFMQRLYRWKWSQSKWANILQFMYLSKKQDRLLSWDSKHIRCTLQGWISNTWMKCAVSVGYANTHLFLTLFSREASTPFNCSWNMLHMVYQILDEHCQKWSSCVWTFIIINVKIITKKKPYVMGISRIWCLLNFTMFGRNLSR